MLTAFMSEMIVVMILGQGAVAVFMFVFMDVFVRVLMAVFVVSFHNMFLS
jgi:hypothetical protein